MVSIVWSSYAIPLYWRLLPKQGSSSFEEQKSILGPVIRMLKPFPILLLGNREFHSSKLAKYLEESGLAFALRQRNTCQIRQGDAEFKPVTNLDIKPGKTLFPKGIDCNKT
jgi:hypothetical protein